MRNIPGKWATTFKHKAVRSFKCCRMADEILYMKLRRWIPFNAPLYGWKLKTLLQMRMAPPGYFFYPIFAIVGASTKYSAANLANLRKHTRRSNPGGLSQKPF